MCVFVLASEPKCVLMTEMSDLWVKDLSEIDCSRQTKDSFVCEEKPRNIFLSMKTMWLCEYEKNVVKN